jgi:hypothetical protein
MLIVVLLAQLPDYGHPRAFAFGGWLGLAAFAVASCWLVWTGSQRKRRRRFAVGVALLVCAALALLGRVIPDNTSEPSVVSLSLPMQLLGLRQEPSQTVALQRQQTDRNGGVAAFYGSLDDGFVVIAEPYAGHDTRQAAHTYLSGMVKQGYVLTQFTSVDSGDLGGHGECAMASRAGSAQQMCAWASRGAIMLFVDGHDATLMQSAERGLQARSGIVHPG